MNGRNIVRRIPIRDGKPSVLVGQHVGWDPLARYWVPVLVLALTVGALAVWASW